MTFTLDDGQALQDGDVVLASIRDDALQGLVSGAVLQVAGTTFFLSTLQANGWSFDLIKSGTPPLPTRYGFYVDKNDDVWFLDQNEKGMGWVGCPHGRGRYTPVHIPPLAGDDLRKWGGWTRLDSVANVAFAFRIFLMAKVAPSKTEFIQTAYEKFIKDYE